METKLCKKCNCEKPLTEFTKHAKSPDGLYYICKSCKSEFTKQYYTNNKEKYNSANRKYKEANPDYDKNYYEKNKETLINYAKTRYNEKNEYFVNYREAHKNEQQEKRWSSFGITMNIDLYNQMLETQNNRCDCCGHPHSDSGKLVVHYNQDTKEVHALVCKKCLVWMSVNKMIYKPDSIYTKYAHKHNISLSTFFISSSLPKMKENNHEQQ